MNAAKPPRRRRIAGETQPGQTQPGQTQPGQTQPGAPQKPAARRPATPRTPARPVVPTPQPAPSRREREAAKDQDVTPTVRRPSRPLRETGGESSAATRAKPTREPAAKPTHESEVAATRGALVRRAAPFVLAVVGVAAALGGYWQMQRTAPLSYDDAQAASDAASTAVVAVLSFDYRDLDAYEAGVDGLLTDGYVASELDPSVAALREQAPAAQVQVQTTVQAAATETCNGECPAGEASVLVVIDKVTLAANLQTPTVATQRLRVSMVETDGRWLVDAIQYIGV